MGCSPLFQSLNPFLFLQKDFSMLTFLNQPAYFRDLCFYVCLLALHIHTRFSSHLPDASANIFQTCPLERTSFKLRRAHQILKTCMTTKMAPTFLSCGGSVCHHTTAALPDGVQTLYSGTLHATAHTRSSQCSNRTQRQAKLVGTDII